MLAFQTLISGNTGFLDFNGYYDTRNESVMTINILANLDHRIQYFSLTNVQGTTESAELGGYYSEHNVRWRIRDTSSFDLTLQFVPRQGLKNDDWKLGFRWRVNDLKPLQPFFKKINFKYSANPMLTQFREATKAKFFTQIEHVYNLKIAPKKLNDRVYIAGFWDQVFSDNNGKLEFDHVTEHQLGIRLVDQFFIVTEFRINTYLPQDNTGLGYGLQYKVIF